MTTTSLETLARAGFLNDGLPALERYVAIPCLSPAFAPDWASDGHLRRAAEMLARWCAKRPVPGLEVEVVALEGRTPVVFATIPASPGREGAGTTVIYGHLDKQPPLGAWREGLDPFRAVREGERLYGRGAADDGYATFCAFAALEALASSGTGHGRVVVLIEGSEESGSPDLDAYLDALGERIGTPALVCCLDSGAASYDRLWVTTSLRGNLVVSVRVDVLEEGVHSGSAGGIVPSSFRILRQLLDRIEDPATGALRLDALYGEVPAGRLAEIEAVAGEFDDPGSAFPTVNGLVLAGADPVERILNNTWRPALAYIGIDGVPAVRDGGNVLRPYTELKLSLRLPPNVDATAAMAAVDAALLADPPHGARVSTNWEAPADGWDAPAPAPWLAEAVEAASLAAYGATPRFFGIGGSIPFLAALGARFPATQFLATGVLGPGSNAHGPNESLHVGAAANLAAALALVIASVP